LAAPQEACLYRPRSAKFIKGRNYGWTIFWRTGVLSFLRANPVRCLAQPDAKKLQNMSDPTRLRDKPSAELDFPLDIFVGRHQFLQYAQF